MGIWHSSMNRFVLRYLYTPLGGKSRTWLTVPATFGFVAYWHEGTGFLTHPWWYLWGTLNALGVISEKFIGETIGRSVVSSAESGNVFAKILRFIGRGMTPILLM